MRIHDLQQRIAALGANPAHTQRVLRHWVQSIPLDRGRRELEHYLPLALREALPALMAELAGLARLRSEHPGEDGSARLLVDLADGQMVHYLDIGPVFLEDDGTLSKEVMPDLLHLNEKSYRRWAEAIEPKVAELMGEK